MTSHGQGRNPCQVNGSTGLLRIANPISRLGDWVWSDLSMDFRESILQEYRSTQWRGRLYTTLVILPVSMVLLASSVLVGVLLAKLFGMGDNKLNELLCGGVAMLFLSPLWMLTIGAYVERKLMRNRWEKATRSVLEQVSRVDSAVIHRCPLPWYLNSDALFPATVAIVLVAAWFIL